MRHVDPAAIFDRFKSREARGNHVDPRLIKEIQVPGDLFLLTAEDEVSFLSLIWQEIDPTRLLTPARQPRTLRDVAERMIRNSWTFANLAAPMGLPQTQHNPDAFVRFKELDAAFNFDELDLVAIMPTNDAERRQSPGGTFYVYDGVCRTLVLAYKLLNKQIAYQPVELLLLIPRRA
jgi:hypothetical protein